MLKINSREKFPMVGTSKFFFHLKQKINQEKIYPQWETSAQCYKRFFCRNFRQSEFRHKFRLKYFYTFRMLYFVNGYIGVFWLE